MKRLDVGTNRGVFSPIGCGVWVLPVLFLSLSVLPAASQTVAVTHGEIHTVSGAVIRDGTILFTDGLIQAVGSDVEIPAGARVVDARGKVVTPGLLDSNTRLGVVEIGAYAGSVDASSGNDQVTAAFNVAEGINPNSSLLPVTRVEGITRVVVAPGSGVSLIAGQSVLINLGGGRLSEMLEASPVGMLAVIGEAGARYTGGSRPLALLRLREVFEDVRDYSLNRRAFAAGDRRSYSLSRLDLEAMVPVLEGEIPLVLQVNRASDILTALSLKEELGVELVLSGALEGWMVAEEIAAAGVPVMTNTMINLPTVEALGARYENAALLHEAGVKLILSSFDAHNVRNLKQGAGFAVSYGLPHEEALRAVTLTPAEVWGVDDGVGSLEVGKEADVVVWSGDPFELSTSVEHVFIKGQEISYHTRQKALFERYRTLTARPPWR